MRISWNEVRTRARQFANEWQDAGYEKGETHTFYNEFFQIFGITLKRFAYFEEPVKLLGAKRGFIDVFWKGVLLIEQKSAGKDLTKAKQQALDYFPGLKEHELPRYILLSDFQQFELHDVECEKKPVTFTLKQLPDYVEHFGFIMGVEKRVFRDQDPVNVNASELMGKLHDALKASGYGGHDLERFLVRLVFCLFADHTGIFDTKGVFSTLIAERTNPDGSDTGLWLSQLFDVLNLPVNKRQKNLDEDLAQFPYVNGDLFAERLPFPSFDSKMRALLLSACEFKWDVISPAIFGSLFQSVMLKKERRSQGAHYTTEKNILKVIEPLFLDDLRAEFKRLKDRRDTGRTNAIKAFHKRLGALRFFDPACGCGNFLIITYREMRALEIDVLKELVTRGQLYLNIESLSLIDVDQFYGIELAEFPARIAEVALWMMDHIMNNLLSVEFGENYVRIPLKKSPHILNADALETDWTALLPPNDCSYVFGNPPFGGAKYQSEKQRAQVKRIAKLGGSGGTLDFVTAWFIKAGEYLDHSKANIGLVATNSITQGEQVAQLWPVLFERFGIEISFGHRTFMWGSDARGKAHVHVVIIGLTRKGQEPAVKRLFSYPNIKEDPVESKHATLTAYLFDAGTVNERHLVVRETANPINGAPKMVIGSKPIDGGYLIFDDDERNAFLKNEPGAARFMQPFIGANEYLYSTPRFILALQKASPSEIRAMPSVVQRLKEVREYRSGERPPRKKVGCYDFDKKKPGTSACALADTPAEFHVTVIPNAPFLCIPETTSETREYVPISWVNPPAIPSNLVRILRDADLWHFGILTSSMHMAWLRQIGGRLESRYRYSVGIVYNTFPWPEVTDKQKAHIRTLAQAVLDARLQFPDSTLADLYDVDVMPPKLRKAHSALDGAVDKLYRAIAFLGDLDRAEHLFGMYEKLVTPLMAVTNTKGQKK